MVLVDESDGDWIIRIIWEKKIMVSTLFIFFSFLTENLRSQGLN